MVSEASDFGKLLFKFKLYCECKSETKPVKLWRYNQNMIKPIIRVLNEYVSVVNETATLKTNTKTLAPKDKDQDINGQNQDQD